MDFESKIKGLAKKIAKTKNIKSEAAD